jgi:16S rRNA (uracil1498-N3)-methyltransferase
VRRTKPGERLLLGDGRGGVATAEVTEVGRDRLGLRILHVERVPAPSPTVTLAQALVKGDRGELSVELATEAGIDEILPWRAARCVARWEAGPRGDKALARWRSTVLAAAKQSRRAWLPVVGDPVGTTALAARCGRAGVALVLHEDADTPLTAGGWRRSPGTTGAAGASGIHRSHRRARCVGCADPPLGGYRTPIQVTLPCSVRVMSERS